MKMINVISRFILVPFTLLNCQTKHNSSLVTNTNVTNTNATTELTDEQIFKLTEEQIFDGTVHQLIIHMDGETWRKVTTHKDQGGDACTDDAPYGHIKTLQFINGKTGKETKIHNAGLRIKGNTSCDNDINSRGFKIKFNPLDKIFKNANNEQVGRVQKIFEKWGQQLNYSEDTRKEIKEQNFLGLESVTLRSGADVSRIRDTLATDVVEYSGEISRQNNNPDAPLRGGSTYRGGMVWLKIHNGFDTLLEGHFGIVSLIDKEMINLHYGKKALKNKVSENETRTGHLFKMKNAKGSFLPSDMPRDNLKWLFSDYQPEIVNGRSFVDGREYDEMKRLCQSSFRNEDLTNKDCEWLDKQWGEAKNALFGFVDSLNEAVKEPDYNLRREKISKILDIENILGYMVATNLNGHWDSLVGSMANNDYLFYNAASGKWAILTWDLDNTFGAGYKDYQWMANLKDFGVDLKYRPVFKPVLDNFYEEYKQMAKKYLDGIYRFDRMNERVINYRNAITGGQNDDRFQMIFNFVSHRYGNAYCHLNHGSGKKVKIKDGWPEVYNKDGQWIANCEAR